jgi:hypothetical protein
MLRIRIGFNADQDLYSALTSMRIRILIRLSQNKKLNFYMKNIFYVRVGNTTE